MAGTIEGGRKASETNKRKYGNDFYKIQGAKGGKKTGIEKGFSHPLLCDCEYVEDLHKKAQCAGAKGGKISRRGRATK